MDKIKLKLVELQYKKETLIFRMFFDKHFRPDRFKDIVENMDNYKNINEFRTYIINRYHAFPVNVIKNLKLIKTQSRPKD